MAGSPENTFLPILVETRESRPGHAGKQLNLLQLATGGCKCWQEASLPPAVILFYWQLNDQTFQNSKSGQEKVASHNPQQRNAEKKKRHPGLHNPMIFKHPLFFFSLLTPGLGRLGSSLEEWHRVASLDLYDMDVRDGLERFHPYEAPQNTSANETFGIEYFTKKWLHPILTACEIFELS